MITKFVKIFMMIGNNKLENLSLKFFVYFSFQRIFILLRSICMMIYYYNYNYLRALAYKM